MVIYGSFTASHQVHILLISLYNQIGIQLIPLFPTKQQHETLKKKTELSSPSFPSKLKVSHNHT